jgi:hypothetical protein
MFTVALIIVAAPPLILAFRGPPKPARNASWSRARLLYDTSPSKLTAEVRG